MYDYIRLIVRKNFSICSVGDREYSLFSKHDVHISRTTITDVIFKFVEIVQKNISEEVIGKRSALLFYGWTHNLIHFFVHYLVYITKDSVLENWIATKQFIARLKLISASPMENSGGNKIDCESVDEHIETKSENEKSDTMTHIHFWNIWSVSSIIWIMGHLLFVWKQCREHAHIQVKR